MCSNIKIMSIICKTGCSQQVVYENIEFTDGFAYQCPHNLDNSLHYCPIFHSNSTLFGYPGGPDPFDHNPYRENSYGDEILKIEQILTEFDELVISKNKNLSLEDVKIYKTRLQSFLNMFPINGLYTDATDGMHELSKQHFEKAMESGALNNQYSEYFESKQFGDENYQYNVHNTLSSSPLAALKKLYYILEGDSVNFKKCQQLEKEISENTLEWIPNYEENYHELQLIESKKQLEFFQNKLKNNNHDHNIDEKKIKEIIEYYYELINDIQKEIDRWYEQKKDHLHDIAISQKLKISLDEAQIFSRNHWDIMTTELKEDWINALDENMEDKSKIMGLDYKELEISHPKIATELLEWGVFGSDSSRQIVNKKEKIVTTKMTHEDYGLFDINKIREFIFQNAHNDVEVLVEEILSTSPEIGESSQNISSEFEKYESPKYDFNSHIKQNSVVHLSNAEKHLRKLIINEIYDYDINFLKKHFKQIWTDMENIRLRVGKNISTPKEETVLDYATFGQLLEILKNKESRTRAKVRKIESWENLISTIEMILPYRNQLSHNRGTVDGDLDIDSKLIVVGNCNKIDEFCYGILYK